MKLDKESWIVIGIALLLLIGWGVYYPQYQAKEAALYQEQQAAAQVLAAKAEVARKAAEQKAREDGEKPRPDTPEPKTQSSAAEKSAPEPSGLSRFPPVLLANDLAVFTIDPNAGTVDQVELKQYTDSNQKNRIVFDTSLAPRKTFALQGLEDWRTVEASPPKKLPEAVSFSKTLEHKGEKIILTRIFSLPKNSYSLQYTILIENPGKELVILPILKIWAAGLPPMKQFAGDDLYSDMHRIEYCGTASKTMISLDPAMKEEKFKAAGTELPVDWIGSTNKYFASLLFAKPVFDGGVDVLRTPHAVPNAGENTFYYVPAIAGVYRNLSFKPGARQEFSIRCFTGPKTLDEVKKLPETAIPILHISSLSLMEYLARPVLWLLNYLKALCGSYGMAIILLTLIVRIVFFPLTERGNKSMRQMQKVAPKAKEIREKYKDNPKLMNQKTMELYKQEGVNPMGGCLPILLQLPVFFALYAALDSAVELRHVSFLWAADLTRPDLVGPAFFFGYGIHPLVLIMTALMVVQQMMTPSTMDPTQQKMMMAMPVIMLFILYNLPSGLTLYWTVSQIFSILQMKYSLYIAKRDEEKQNAPVNSKPA